MTMPTRKPDADVTPDTPAIQLAGVSYPVPLLAPRQNRFVVPAMLRLRTLHVRLEAGLKPGGTATTLVTEQDMDDLGTIAFMGLTRAHVCERAAFDDMAITMPELLEAMKVVSQQSGILKPAAPGDASAPGGQLTGATAS